MSNVTVYVTTYCPYCNAAKRFLERHSVPYETVDVTRDHDKRIWLMKTTGMRTVPQIFVGQHSVGGYDDMNAMHSRGELMPLLDEEGVPHSA